MTTKIITCECTHAFQDKKYGKQKRVANKIVTTPMEGPKYRCTVCSKVKSA